MTRANVALWSVAGILLAIGAAACAAEDGAFDGASRSPTDVPGSDNGGDRSPPEAGAQGPLANGVVLVHAAAFPSFRLCFENAPELPPQPDTKVMPEANVVGVEMGSLVRVDPLAAPGRIFVIHESKVRGSDAPCRERLGTEIGAPKTPRMLVKNNDYHVIDAIEGPLGQDGVQVLAIAGCGSESFLDSLFATPDGCGDDWDYKGGNLSAKVIDLTPSNIEAGDGLLPVQLFHLSPAIDAFTARSGSLTVSFGVLSESGGLEEEEQLVPAGDLFSGGAAATLSVDQSNEAIYGSHGFRIVMKSSGDAAPPVLQSLATVQELSAPRDVPTTYYRAASNYALLLLGDPEHRPTLENGEENPDFNPRQGVHILAVPVIDPEAAGGDADAGAGREGELGDGTGPDAGAP